MSWASSRSTTRVEDIAYSLMGIFDVNMPPLYGEGDKAFRRLQLEIMKYSRDESIFSWSWNPYKAWSTQITPLLSQKNGLLAVSPSYFSPCHGVNQNDRYRSRPPFSISNKGLHIWLPFIRTKNVYGNEVLLAWLNCILADGNQIFIVLELQSDSGEYSRWHPDGFTFEKEDSDTIFDPMEMYIVDQEPDSSTGFSSRYSTPSGLTSMFHFDENTSPETGYRIDSFFYAGMTGRGTDVPLNRTFVFKEGGYSKTDYLDFMYLVVTSIQDPSVRATIALGTAQTSPTPTTQWRSKTTYHCRIFPESKGPSSHGFFVDYLSRSQDKTFRFSQIFSGDNLFQYSPSDQIVRRLPGGYAITMSARAGPVTGSATGPSVDFPRQFDHHYHVLIAFSRLPSLREKIPEADNALDNESANAPGAPRLQLKRKFQY